MITKDNAWIYPEAYEKAKRDGKAAEKEGFVKVPDWFPVPTPGYEYRILGQMDAYMKPKPKLRHKIRFVFHRYRAMRLKREIDRMWKGARNDSSTTKIPI